jgi:probable HAF family extracellular repeat protein
MMAYSSQAIRWLGTAVLATAVLVPAPSAQAGTSAAYRITDLGTLPGGTYSVASGINERGDAVGESDGHAVLWGHGRIVDLGTLGGQYSSAVDINERGDVVGYSTVAGSGGYHGFLWRHGRMVELRPLAGDENSFPTAINDRGDVVGYSTGGGVRSVLWPAHGGAVDLTARTGLRLVQDLDNHGRFVGEIAPDGMNGLAVLWSAGHTTVLSDTSGAASAINDRGEVTGYYFVGKAGSFVWHRGHLTDIPLLPNMPPASMMQAQAINNRGQVVGFGGYEGFLWTHGKLVVLPHLYGHGPAAFDINDRGQIVGQVGTTPDNLQPHAVLLSPSQAAAS